MTEFRCFYCTNVRSRNFAEMVDHCIIRHDSEELKLKVATRVSSSTTNVRTKNFKIIPAEIKKDNKFIIPQCESYTLNICNISSELLSPVKKKCGTESEQNDTESISLTQKLSSVSIKDNSHILVNSSNDSANDHESMVTSSEMSTRHTQTEDSAVINLNETNTNDQVLLKEILQLVPTVLENLKSCNKQDMYVKFHTLINENKLPMNNIAFLLFSDVVEWFSKSNTHAMRYSQDVKQFWKVGHELFKGKFLRFMAGWKNQGQEAKGHTKPDESVINFAVPDRKYLDSTELSHKLKNIQPGILDEMIELIYDDSCCLSKTFKLCVDGKKINHGAQNQVYGDVNLWGYEGPPTLQDCKDKLSIDKKLVEDFTEILNKIEKRDIYDLYHTPEHLKNDISRVAKQMICNLSQRLRKLRTVKQSKVIALEKLKVTCINDAMKAKYSYALSAIKTFIFKLDLCISRLLRVIDSVGHATSVCNGVQTFYNKGDACDLSIQQNYVCLTGLKVEGDIQNLNTSLIKQRSDEWHSIRKTAKVTGSTAHQALGLSGLKKLQEHFEYVFHQKDRPDFSEDAQKRMKYGTDNEINAIGTLVSKILPIFYPNFSFVEEGCEVVCDKDETFLIVSPDGSARYFNSENYKPSDAVALAIEIKCPYPNKLYTTPVYYKMPWYYVIQVLSEMYVLNASSLLFLCYSTDSTTVCVANFDEELWNEILAKLKTIYGTEKPVMPKKLPDELKTIKEKIKTYCDNKVQFLAEIPSCQVNRECKHEHSSVESEKIGRNCHTSCLDSVKPHTKHDVTTLQMTTIEINSCLDQAYSLERHLASEVLIFLISDLDRIHEREKQHSTPVGFSMKGYSLTSSVMRKMIDDTLQRCYLNGLYTPVVSFDGQWSQLAVRSSNGHPLTILQLQKDVFRESKKMSKSEIVRSIKNTNIVKAKSLNELIEQTLVEQKFRKNEEHNNFYSLIVSQNNRQDSRLYKTSPNVLKFLRSKISLNEESTEVEEEEATSKTVLDALPPQIAETVDENMISEIDSVCTNSKLDTCTHISLDMTDSLNDIFEDNLSEKITESMEVDVSDPIDTSATSTELNDSPMSFLTASDFERMLSAIVLDKKVSAIKWQSLKVEDFANYFELHDGIGKKFTRHELQICVRTISQKLKTESIQFTLSWPKAKLIELLFQCVSSPLSLKKKLLGKKKEKKMLSLKKMCIIEIDKFPKHILNIIYAEHIFPGRFTDWQQHSPFAKKTLISGIEQAVTWYSMPEYIPERYMYQFNLLDCHHLFVNARVKCCSTGIDACGIKKEAWIKVAKNSNVNGCGLSLALVEDLVDKQSNGFAQKTFSEDVEKALHSNGDFNEALFCRLIREWYAAEDDPGIDVIDRIKRRLRFRDWLLKDINFMQFPPPGLHVKGIPHIMFEGLLTNIERRIQIIPFVKSGSYNSRALGSLEAENFFGAFQDLDPKGSGIIRPDDVPAAIRTACDLIGTRLDPNRKFAMHTSRAKVYPVHELEKQQITSLNIPYITPTYVESIVPRNHTFDSPERAKRSYGKRKRGEISDPSMSSRGARPIRQHHRCDESKILPHVRMGLDITENEITT
ncbi:uncharacterized protein [Mytilus edulis]|uniref:uncharacterized protein n=1 Tax=Mytilus edulis TaxID=6550 RepID=UPI0039EF0828